MQVGLHVFLFFVSILFSLDVAISMFHRHLSKEFDKAQVRFVHPIGVGN